jgi:hypothetical protein
VRKIFYEVVAFYLAAVYLYQLRGGNQKKSENENRNSNLIYFKALIQRASLP